MFKGLAQSGSYVPRGEIPQPTGNSPGNSTRRILACEMSALNMTVSQALLAECHRLKLLLRRLEGNRRFHNFAAGAQR